MSDKLISKIPEGPLEQKWTKRKSEIHLVSPNNKRKLEIIVVGTGLGGASAAASLGELGYNVKVFCISTSPIYFSLLTSRVTIPFTHFLLPGYNGAFFSLRICAISSALIS